LRDNQQATLIDLAEIAAREAGKSILSFYRTRLAIDTKSDGSPLTKADETSHRITVDILSQAGIPIVSEEGDDLELHAIRYWLVDPLDGTKDFIAANDEFTVNIGLIEDGKPVLGLVYAPALDELYVGIAGDQAWRDLRGTRTLFGRCPKSIQLRMARSRFHDHPDAEAFAIANGVNMQIAIGSALKYGRLAMGEVDVYPRFVGTSEWDTAAGQAVLEAAGGRVLDWHTHEPLHYGKPKRRNGQFIAFRAPYEKNDFEF
jgi:3'(2'), 5'-bisphosphate nucleotidase